LFGVLVCGLTLNVLGAYVVRWFDRVRDRLPAHFRQVREKELERIQLLSAAASSDSGLYAALSAEAGRLRLHQLLGFLIAFVGICAILLLIGAAQVDAYTGARMTTSGRIEALLAIAFLLPMSGLQFTSGLENGRRARRLDIALRAVQRNRSLPIMD
jgi:hypothetical protein